MNRKAIGFFSLLLAFGIAIPAVAEEEPVDVGDEAPDFVLIKKSREVKQDINLLEFAEDQPVVLFFYPSDFTPGCTLEMQTLQEKKEEFDELGVEIFGVSMNDERSHERFCDQLELEFPLIADTDLSIAAAYGVKRTRGPMSYAARATFLVYVDGTIAWLNRDFNADPRAGHYDDLIDAIKELDSWDEEDEGEGDDEAQSGEF
ncbi:MAG: peroxiredoxin [Planctomycetes bacterium]|nr:peroxiredoxin [Planctomycetota bacterium]